MEYKPEQDGIRCSCDAEKKSDMTGVKIEGQEINRVDNYLDPVTYVPPHAVGNAGHEDCERGVIIDVHKGMVSVLYCIPRKTQKTRPEDLVWG